MSTGLDIGFIRESYRSRSDQELLYIISQDANGLTPEAIQVIKEELARRNLDTGLGELVAVQNKEYTKEELDELCSILDSIRCPHCGSKETPLTAFTVYQALSFLVITHFSKTLHVGCANCVRSKTNTAMGISVLMGWWGIPWGPIRTIQSFFHNANAYNAVEQHPNDYLRALMLSNVGLFTQYREDPDKIAIMINNLAANKPITSGINMMDGWGVPAK